MAAVRGWRLAVVLGLLLMAVSGGTVTRAAVSPPSAGGFADGAFCTHGKGYFSNNSDVAPLIQGGLPFSIGTGANTYTWKVVSQPPQTAAAAVAALQQAVGDGGTPGAFSASATNPTDMGTGGSLAAQTLAESLNNLFATLE